VTIAIPAPISAFGFQDTLYQVSFFDSSQNTINWFWDFGDGNTSTAQNPMHIYPANGVYLACLITENLCGARDTLCQNVLVDCPIPIANFGTTPNQLTATFSDSSANTTTWNWDFGDGSSSVTQNPSHTYATCGSYNVCLISSNSCGTDTFCQQINFLPSIPVITQIGATLYASPGISYQWFTNGNPGIADTLQSFLPTIPGFYQVEVIDSNGCTALSDSVYVLPVNVGSSAQENGPQVFPNPVSLSSTSGRLNVAFSSPHTGDFELFSNLGKRLRTWNFGSELNVRYALLLDGLTSGVYYLRIKYQDQFVVKKVELVR
jgi:PKD repeat protein